MATALADLSLQEKLWCSCLHIIIFFSVYSMLQLLPAIAVTWKSSTESMDVYQFFDL